MTIVWVTHLRADLGSDPAAIGAGEGGTRDRRTWTQKGREENDRPRPAYPDVRDFQTF